MVLVDIVEVPDRTSVSLALFDRGAVSRMCPFDVFFVGERVGRVGRHKSLQEGQAPLAKKCTRACFGLLVLAFTGM
jgi:hypothetical protein